MRVVTSFRISCIHIFWSTDVLALLANARWNRSEIWLVKELTRSARVLKQHKRKCVNRRTRWTPISNMDEEPTTSTELEPVPCSSDSERHPWPYLSKLFEFKGSKNDSWRFQCVKCLPQRKELLAFKNSPSNLKKHIEVRHAMLVINI